VIDQGLKDFVDITPFNGGFFRVSYSIALPTGLAGRKSDFSPGISVSRSGRGECGCRCIKACEGQSTCAIRRGGDAMHGRHATVQKGKKAVEYDIKKLT
jgi:hypothetical protein